jgi:hypothetical protein
VGSCTWFLLTYRSGFQSGSAGPDVSIGLVTPNGAGNLTIVVDTNNGGIFTALESASGTYAVSAHGRTTTTGITSNSQSSI